MGQIQSRMARKVSSQLTRYTGHQIHVELHLDDVRRRFLTGLHVIHHSPAVREYGDEVRLAADHGTGTGTLYPERVLALNERLTSLLFKFGDQIVVKGGAIGLLKKPQLKGDMLVA